jgi:uncharacterized membrane protein
MYQLNVWIHVLMAAVWTGGLIYTAAVAVPFAISHEGQERQRILRGLARRFRWIGWGSIIVLIITGLGNLTLRLSPIHLGQLFNGEAFNPDLVDRFIAVWLPWKLLLVVIMVGLILFHDISREAARRVAGRRAGQPRRLARRRACHTRRGCRALRLGAPRSRVGIIGS